MNDDDEDAEETDEDTSYEGDWRGKGYFSCPAPPANIELPSSPLTDPWLWWQVAFYRAKNGDFALLPGLIEIVLEADDHFLEATCSLLLGDAGTSDCFDVIIRELTTTGSTELTLDFSDALATRGRLADVPVILQAYMNVADIEDAAVIPTHLSDLLEAEVGVIADPSLLPSLNEYETRVMNRYHELVKECGTDQLLVVQGEKFGVVPLAKQLFDRARRPHFPSDLRRRFSTSTGIDTARFFKNGEFQPLTAAAMIEEFLESSRCREISRMATATFSAIVFLIECELAPEVECRRATICTRAQTCSAFVCERLDRFRERPR